MTNRSLLPSSSSAMAASLSSASSSLLLLPSAAAVASSSSNTPQSSSSNSPQSKITASSGSGSQPVPTTNPTQLTGATSVPSPPTASLFNTKVSLEMPLLLAEKLYPTPSMLDNLPFEVEFDLRLTGCELIQTAGRLLKLPQTAMATGQVLFHRFFYSKSFVRNSMEYFAMAAIFLSSKIEECPRRLRDVMNVFHHLKLVQTGKVIKPMVVDEKYNETKTQVIRAERRILKDLGFCVHVKHPHKIIFIYLQAMECTQLNLSQKAWNYMNDSLRTDIFLRYSPENIVCACIYLSANELQIPLPQNPAWYTIFGADEESIKEICVRILHLYSHQPKPQDELEKLVNECRERLDEEKRKLKESASQSSIATGLKAPDSSAKEGPKEDSSKIPSDSAKQGEKDGSHSSSLRGHKSHSNPTSESASVLSHSNPYYLNHHHHPGGHHHPMSRHSSFNYSYYHHQNPQYMNGNGAVYPYHDSYHNENYYEAGLKKNKSTSALLPQQHVKDIEEYSHKRHSKSRKSSSKDRTSRSAHKDDLLRSKISNQTNNYEYRKSKSRSRSRSPWKKPKKDKSEKKSSRNSHRRVSRSRSRSRSMASVESDADRDSKSPVPIKHKKKSHSRRKDASKEREKEAEKTRDHEEKERSTSSHHRRHKSSKSKARSKDRENTNESRYMPICS